MSISKSELHIAALDYANRGWKIFPCLPGAKQPATPNGYKDASSDPAVINRWWNDNPNYNLATCPADQLMAVIEHDAYKGGSDADFKALNLPPTYEVESPHGGTHYYFFGDIATSAHTLGQNIDTRGRGGYVLIPPSIVDGKRYHVKSNRAFADLPLEIEARVGARNHEMSAPATELDQDTNVQRALTRLRDLASRGDVAISGSGGNSRTYQLAAELTRDFGLSPDKALQLVLTPGGWNDQCLPPWSEDELTRIFANAGRYGQNSEGVYAVAPISEVFADADFSAVKTAPEVKTKFKIYTGSDMTELPEPHWIIPELLPEGSVGIFSAPKGSFKSFLTLDACMGVASGLETFAGEPLETGLTFFGAHEGFNVIGKVHYPAWCEAKGLNPKEDNGFYLMRGPRVAYDEALPFAEAIDRQVQRIGEQPRLIALDTYSRCMVGLNENDPGDANKFMDFCYSLVENWPGVSVIVPAHKGKDGSKGTRGSSAFEAACDFVIDIDRKDRSSLVEVSVKFQRAGKERDMAYSLQGKKIAGSLVFEQIARSDISAMERMVNMFDYRNVAHILRSMGATNDNIAVTTDVLATTMTARDPNDSEEVYSAKCRATAQTLTRLTRRQLKALCIGQGKTLRWFVPNLEASQMER